MRWATGFALVLLLAACVHPDPLSKVELDLSSLDADGLAGPPGGKVSLAFECCIPDTPEARAGVLAIDPAFRLSPSRGRIGCGDGTLLLIGETHGRDWRTRLRALAALPYIDRIAPCHFE